jgi:methionine aminotransferase
MAFAANTPIQHALAAYMKEGNAWEEVSVMYQQKRDQFRQMLKGSAFKLLPCQGTYFQLLAYEKLSQDGDVELARRWTIEAGIASVPVSVFYHDKTDHKVLRFCFAKTEETLGKAARALQAIQG